MRKINVMLTPLTPLILVFGWLVLGCTVQAASFDCAKAQTKVEHLICDNAEISKLDDDLATSYKAALEDKTKAESIKQAQKQWIKKRNNCKDADCVQVAYETRLSGLPQRYILAMGKDDKFCNSILDLYNADMKEYGWINYDRHGMFAAIKWQADDKFRTHAYFDINNDGKDELVIKVIWHLRGYENENLYIYPVTSDVLSKLKPGPDGLHALLENSAELFSSGNQIYILRDLPKTPEAAWIGGYFVLKPFIWEDTNYISMTDLNVTGNNIAAITPRWIVIAKYKQAEELQDICYFLNPRIAHQR